MKKNQFIPTEIIGIHKGIDNGKAVGEINPEHGVNKLAEYM